MKNTIRRMALVMLALCIMTTVLVTPQKAQAATINMKVGDTMRLTCTAAAGKAVKSYAWISNDRERIWVISGGTSSSCTVEAVGLGGFSSPAIVQCTYYYYERSTWGSTVLRSGTQDYYITVSGSGSSGSSGSSSSGSSSSMPMSIVMSDSNITLYVGETYDLDVTYYPYGSYTTTQWESDKTGVATVSSSGLVKAVAPGKATIYASFSRSGYAKFDLDGCTVTVVDKLRVTDQPDAGKAKAGTDVSFSVKAEGVGMKYQWQRRKNAKGAWTDYSDAGSKTAKLTVTAADSLDGSQFRCKITDKKGNVVYSQAATLTAIPAIRITRQPVNRTLAIGKTATFAVRASGEGLKYQWQVRTPGGKWKNVSGTGNRTATFKVKVTRGRNGNAYRCRITDAQGRVAYSRAVRLKVK